MKSAGARGYKVQHASNDNKPNRAAGYPDKERNQMSSSVNDLFTLKESSVFYQKNIGRVPNLVYSVLCD